MFGKKKHGRPVNVQFYLGRIDHNLKSAMTHEGKKADPEGTTPVAKEGLNYDQNRQYAIWIRDFVKRYIKERKDEIYKTKRTNLQNALDALNTLIKGLKKKEPVADLRVYFLNVVEYFEEYAEKGAIYMIRHPEKWKAAAGKDRKDGRNISKKGVKQAKEFTEKIIEEILLAPRKVMLELYTSEFRRTFLQKEMIKRLSMAEKLHKDVEVFEKKEPRIYLSPIGSDDADKIYEKLIEDYGKEKGPAKGFFEWKERKGGYGEIIERGEIDPIETTRDKIRRFVDDLIIEGREEDYYVISIGMSHTWVLDSFLIDYFNFKQTIKVAEYYKIEEDHIWFRGDWARLG